MSGEVISIKEMEDRLNEMLIEKIDSAKKIEQLETENQSLREENIWLTILYKNFLAKTYNQLDEMCYEIKHSSIPEEKSKNT